MSRTSHFQPELFRFLRELAANNNREWFNAQKERYLRVARDPMLAFIRDFAPHLAKISRYYVADPAPQGGSMFRIYKDMRFASEDEGPYKTHIAAHFRHKIGRNVHAPGFYVQLAPREIYAGCGIWRPDAKVRTLIKARIIDEPEAWRAVVKSRGMKRLGGVDGEFMSGAPRGVPVDHEFYDDIRRRDWLVGVGFTAEDVWRPDFLDRFAGVCRDGAPLMRFLCEAMNLPW